MTTVPSIADTFQEQAAQRFAAYRAELLSLGLTPGLPFRTIAVLTTDLPGEAIEVAVIMEDGQAISHRARPTGIISASATQIHGLSAGDLEGENTLRARQRGLEARLSAPGVDGLPVPVVAWAGAFVSEALSNSFDSPLSVKLLDLQLSVQAGDRSFNPSARYRPSLGGMNYTVDVPQPDKRSSLSTATCTRLVLDALLNGAPITVPPAFVPQQRGR